MKLRRLLSAPSLGVLYLIGFVYFVTVFVFIEDWVGLHSSVGSWNALGFTIVASLCVFTFLVCVLSEPGHVPSSYVPDVEDRGSSDQVSWKHDSQWNRCDKCHTYKPPRAHHCRVCRRCVLRMDHHCLWINNCVGYWNYKPFFVLLVYMTIASIYSTVIIVSSALQQDWKIPGIHSRKILYGENSLSVSHNGKILKVACGAVTFGLTMVLGTLLCWHIYLILRNMTTIEYYEGKRAMWLARKSGQSYRHPFDAGPYRNISVVLGPNFLKWFCPTAGSHLKDGLSFPTLRDNS